MTGWSAIESSGIHGHDFLAVTWMDITERKARERELDRLNRLYAALSELNQTIARVNRAKSCSVKSAGSLPRRSVSGWFGSVVPTRKRTLIVPVARRPRPRLSRHDQVYADDRPEGGGASGTCLREGKRCIINHVVDDPRIGAVAQRPWPRAHMPCAAAAALPIRFHGKVWGTLTIYDAETDVFQDKEVALLEEVAAAISLALDNLDREANANGPRKPWPPPHANGPSPLTP